MKITILDRFPPTKVLAVGGMAAPVLATSWSSIPGRRPNWWSNAPPGDHDHGPARIGAGRRQIDAEVVVAQYAVVALDEWQRGAGGEQTHAANGRFQSLELDAGRPFCDQQVQAVAAHRYLLSPASLATQKPERTSTAPDSVCHVGGTRALAVALLPAASLARASRAATCILPCCAAVSSAASAP